MAPEAPAVAIKACRRKSRPICGPITSKLRTEYCELMVDNAWSMSAAHPLNLHQMGVQPRSGLRWSHSDRAPRRRTRPLTETRPPPVYVRWGAFLPEDFHLGSTLKVDAVLPAKKIKMRISKQFHIRASPGRNRPSNSRVVKSTCAEDADYESYSCVLLRASRRFRKLLYERLGGGRRWNGL